MGHDKLSKHTIKKNMWTWRTRAPRQYFVFWNVLRRQPLKKEAGRDACLIFYSIFNTKPNQPFMSINKIPIKLQCPSIWFENNIMKFLIIALPNDDLIYIDCFFHPKGLIKRWLQETQPNCKDHVVVSSLHMMSCSGKHSKFQFAVWINYASHHKTSTMNYVLAVETSCRTSFNLSTDVLIINSEIIKDFIVPGFYYLKKLHVVKWCFYMEVTFVWIVHWSIQSIMRDTLKDIRHNVLMCPFAAKYYWHWQSTKIRI